jgi:DSF synthase
MENSKELADLGKYEDLEIELDPRSRALWCYMKPRRSPNFTLYLLRDLFRLFKSIESRYSETKPENIPFRYFVLSSKMPDDVFNYGGDLALFSQLIKKRDREGLRNYAHLCIDALYRIVIHFNVPVTTIALVKGDALAGGLEVALAHDLIIAEEKAKFGVPESHFGLFPGMGAYSFLTRRLGRVEGEKMIFGGNLHTATEMHKLGIVDILAPNGKGDERLNAYIEKTDSRYYSNQCLFRIRSRTSPITYEELIDITDMWVDAALTLCEKDVKRMERLAATQLRKRKMSAPAGRVEDISQAPDSVIDISLIRKAAT